MARPRTICLLLALVTVLVYSPVRRAVFVVFDDPDYIGNPQVQAGLTWAGTVWAFTTWHSSNWHPLTWLSHMLDSQLFGSDAGAQHFVNVLFHAANAVLLFLLLFRVTSRLWPAAFVAALFAWHPLHVESVAWISERKDVLSTMFGLLALLAYVRFAENSKFKIQNSKIWYFWALGFFALGLMAKPMLVTLPFVMVLMDVWPACRVSGARFQVSGGEQQGVTLPALIFEKVPFFLLSGISCVITFLAQRGEAVMSLEQRPFGLRLQNALVSYVEYLAKTVWPVKLAVIYPLPNAIPMWQVLVAVVVLGAISLLAWMTRRRSPYFLFGWLWFLGTLVPVIGLVQVGGQALADRYTYVPLIGVFVVVAYGGADLAARFRIQPAAISTIAGLSLVGCILATERQLTFWQDSEALFGHALKATKNNAIAHINLGVALEQEGRREEALAEYREAVSIEPHRVQVHNNLANLLSAMGWRDEALKEYKEALRLNPNAPLAHANYGTLLSEMGRFDDAMYEYAEAARLAPEDVRPHYLMGKACLRKGKSLDAVKHFHDALQIASNDFQTFAWLARVLAADQDASVRNGAEAVAFAERANSLTGGHQPFVLDTLAMAYAEAGRFKQAQEAIQTAIELAATVGAKDDVPAMQQRLQLYQSNLPYREDFVKAPVSAK